MQQDPISTTSTHANTRKIPRRWAFQRGSAIQPSAFPNEGGWNADALRNQYGGNRDRGGFRAVYNRHASFARSAIARQQLQSISTADPGRFVYASHDHASPINKLQRYSYPAAPTSPVVSPPPALLHDRPYHGQYRSVTMAPYAPVIHQSIRGTVSLQLLYVRLAFKEAALECTSNTASGHANSDTEAEPRTTVQADPPVSRGSTTFSRSHPLTYPPAYPLAHPHL